jgi:hypothetical protein
MYFLIPNRVLGGRNKLESRLRSLAFQSLIGFGMAFELSNYLADWDILGKDLFQSLLG